MTSRVGIFLSFCERSPRFTYLTGGPHQAVLRAACICSSTLSNAGLAYAQLWHLKLRRLSIGALHWKHLSLAIAFGASVLTNFCSPSITCAIMSALCTSPKAEATISSHVVSRRQCG